VITLIGATAAGLPAHDGLRRGPVTQSSLSALLRDGGIDRNQVGKNPSGSYFVAFDGQHVRFPRRAWLAPGIKRPFF
jgi:hypothetical protein